MEHAELSFNDMQTVKRRFFALRNGVVADVLRKNGCPFSIIFGLNIPQIVEIADGTPHSRDLAMRLWQNKTTRESMLLAPLLFPVDEYTEEDAMRWIHEIPSFEIADFICLKLLKKLPFAGELIAEIKDSDQPLVRYTALRLMFNLVSSYTSGALTLANDFLAREKDSRIRVLAQGLKEESEFLLGL